MEGSTVTLADLFPSDWEQLSAAIEAGVGAKWDDVDSTSNGMGLTITGALEALLQDGFYAVVDMRLEYANLDSQIICTYGMEWSNNPVYDTTWGWGSTLSTPFNIDHYDPSRIISATYDNATSSDDEDEMATDVGEALARVAVLIDPSELTISQNGSATATITPVAHPDRNYLTMTTNILNTGPLTATLVWEAIRFERLTDYEPTDLPTLSGIA